MKWNQNHFEAYNSTYQILFVYNITLTWHLDQGHLQFCVNFVYVYGIIWGGKKLTKFYLSFFPTKNAYIYSYRAHLSKIFFTRRFHNISNSHDTVTSCLLAIQNIYIKKKESWIFSQKKVTKGVLIKKITESYVNDKVHS